MHIEFILSYNYILHLNIFNCPFIVFSFYLGLTADCPLNNYTIATCNPIPTDNDGLWTSWSVAAEAFRYQATGSEEARNNAWSLYKGMKFLIEVTGISGLPARSVIRDTGNDTGYHSDGWHASTTNPGWLWKGDTSSDEVFFP